MEISARHTSDVIVMAVDPFAEHLARVQALREAVARESQSFYADWRPGATACWPTPTTRLFSCWAAAAPVEFSARRASRSRWLRCFPGSAKQYRRE
jgi:hypothetical protein